MNEPTQGTVVASAQDAANSPAGVVGAAPAAWVPPVATQQVPVTATPDFGAWALEQMDPKVRAAAAEAAVHAVNGVEDSIREDIQAQSEKTMYLVQANKDLFRRVMALESPPARVAQQVVLADLTHGGISGAAMILPPVVAKDASLVFTTRVQQVVVLAVITAALGCAVAIVISALLGNRQGQAWIAAAPAAIVAISLWLSRSGLYNPVYPSTPKAAAPPKDQAAT